MIPKLYDGHNKTFWTYTYEGIHSADPRGTSTTAVPYQQQLAGDFSALLKIGPQYQIYDPATIAPAANGRFSPAAFSEQHYSGRPNRSDGEAHRGVLGSAESAGYRGR